MSISLSPSPDRLPSAEVTKAEIEQGHSLWSDAWHRLAKNKLAVGGAFVIALLSLTCVLGPTVLEATQGITYEDQTLDIGSTPPGTVEVKVDDPTSSYKPVRYSTPAKLVAEHELAQADVDRIKAGETVTAAGRTYRLRDRVHWLGTDTLGRDLLVRLLKGGQISIGVGLCATFVALSIGVVYGAFSGYTGGVTDRVMMRIVDIMYTLPFAIFVILLMVFFGRHIWLLFAAIGAVEWLTMARIVRGQILSLKKTEFIEAARSLGLGKRRIIFRHMIPNILGPIIVYTTLTIPSVMLLEAFLSFLGLGVQPPLSSWGSLIKDGADKMEEFPWLLIYPGTVFSLTLFSLNFLGDGLRDALDVRASKD